MTTRLNLIPILIFIHAFAINAQNLPTRLAYDGLLWSENDSFYVKGHTWDQPWTFTTTLRDTVDLGTDGFPGQSIKVWTTTDTLTIPYVNAPDEQWLYIKVGSVKDTTIYRLRFNEQNSVYTDEVVRQKKGKITISVPETYELANIILYLTDCSQKTSNHPESGDYVQQVIRHFSPFKNHHLIQVLNKKCRENNYWSTYYGFRENSICFDFNGRFLTFSTPYKTAYWDDSEISGGEFRNLLYLIQDFADQSGFRAFYAAHKNYYNSLEKREAELLPIAQMWEWLEKDFPQRKDAYTIIFSPLIGGSHSTQQFYKGSSRTPEFQECIMFINSTEGIDAQKEYTEKIKEGLMSGIVFTEIDHNYVNPASNEFRKEIIDLMNNKNEWATEAAQKNYPSEMAIFNEYMTHALFCLYITEKYEAGQAQKIIESRLNLMNRRGYLKFKAFNEILTTEMAHRKKTVYQSYRQIIESLNKIK